MFSTTSAQPISPKLLKGLGCCPTSFCTSGYRRALLANSIYGVSKQTGFCKNRRVYLHLLCLLFCKFSRWQVQRFSQVGPHLICLLFSVSNVSKRHFLKWKSAATTALSAKKRNGRAEVNGGAAVHLDH